MATIADSGRSNNDNIPLTKVQQQFFEAIEKGDIDTVQKILTSKEPASSVGAHFQNPNNGTSGLMVAAKFGQHEIVSLLIQHGAPWNALDQYGKSAGDYALKANNQKMVNQLVNIGVQAELLFAALDANKLANKTQVPKAKEKIFIERNVRYEGNALLDDENRGVMMQWEEPLMEAHAEILCQSKGDVLNIGFGMGYIDTAIQKYPVKSHTIIEAHPQVYKKMIADGWDKKPNVKIVFGRWQDVIDKVGTFDSVYFDTFDDVGHLREFHQHLPKLVRPGGMYSFFNGISDNVFFLGVACECIKLELTEMNFSQIEFYPVDIDVSDEEIWKDTSFRYFNSNQYYLPVCIRGED
eukprot:g7795.t1